MFRAKYNFVNLYKILKIIDCLDLVNKQSYTKINYLRLIDKFQMQNNKLYYRV